MRTHTHANLPQKNNQDDGSRRQSVMAGWSFADTVSTLETLEHTAAQNAQARSLARARTHACTHQAKTNWLQG